MKINTIYDLVQALRGRLYRRFEEEGLLKTQRDYIMILVDEEITLLYTELSENIRIPGTRDCPPYIFKDDGPGTFGEDG